MAQDSLIPDADAVAEQAMQYGHGPMSQQELDEKYPNRPHNVHKTLPFHDMYESLFNPLRENTQKKSGPAFSRRKQGPHGNNAPNPHEQRRAIIGRYMSRWRQRVGPDFYPAMRLIIPDKDRDRAMYGLKEKIIAKYLIRVLRIDRDSDDGANLLNWKLPGQGKTSAMAGDFAGRCYEVIRKRPLRTSPGGMSIADVNQRLDQLSLASKEEDQLPIFEEFYQKMNAEELMWLVHIILRQVHVGATEKTILDIWHPDAENLFNVSSSLRRVCWELHDPSIRLDNDDCSITLMQCFQPQLAAFQLHSFDKMLVKMKPTEDDGVFWIEEKLDGERMQLHMAEDATMPGGMRFAFWSRKAKDYTYLYGKAFEGEDATLTRHLKAAFNPGVRNIILDGEMMVWDVKEDAYVPFGHLKTAALAEKQDPFQNGRRPLYKIFDCLYLNDKALTKYTLRDRRKALAASVRNVDCRFEIHAYAVATTSDEIEKQLRRVIAEGSEGLVIKNPRSMYHLNARSDDWIKVKPEYMQEFGEALDCVIVGGYYGSGRRGGHLSSFLCGLLVNSNKASTNPQLCYSFFRVGGGFTAGDYADLRHRTDGKWQKWDQKKPPTEFVELGGGPARQLERPDVWIKPEDSVVIEVKAASVHATEQFRMGYTLRFPRFKKLRADKEWRQALTVHDFADLKNGAEQARKEKEFKLDEGRRAKRPRISRSKPVVVAGSEVAKMDPGAKGSDLFAGLTFFVATESLEPIKKSKAELEAMIKAHGGSITQKENPDLKVICIADRRLVKVQAILKRGKESIIKPAWVFDCVAQCRVDEEEGATVKHLLPMEPKHMFFVIAEDESQVQATVDMHGDSFARDVGVDELKVILAGMPKLERKRSDVDESRLQSGLDDGDRNDRLRGWMFKGAVVSFAHEQESTNTLDEQLLARTVRFAGGRVANAFDDEDVTHVVVFDANVGHIRERVSRRASRLPRIVTRSWVEESWKAGTLLDEERFAPG